MICHSTCETNCLPRIATTAIGLRYALIADFCINIGLFEQAWALTPITPTRLEDIPYES